MIRGFLLGLTLQQAAAYLQSRGLDMQVEVTGPEGDNPERARVVKVAQAGDKLRLTVVYPPSLRLQS
jgi:hypothetical protein